VLGIFCRFFSGDVRSSYCQFVVDKIRYYFYPGTPDWQASIAKDVTGVFAVLQYGLKQISASSFVSHHMSTVVASVFAIAIV
jgi:hypothetical protein